MPGTWWTGTEIFFSDDALSSRLPTTVPPLPCLSRSQSLAVQTVRVGRRSVAELGHKWYQIAERLPGRTDHAIRNRWHRLVTRGTDAAGLCGVVAGEGGVDGVDFGLDDTLEELSNDPMNALDLGALVADDT